MTRSLSNCSRRNASSGLLLWSNFKLHNGHKLTSKSENIIFVSKSKYRSDYVPSSDWQCNQVATVNFKDVVLKSVLSSICICREKGRTNVSRSRILLWRRADQHWYTTCNFRFPYVNKWWAIRWWRWKISCTYRC